MKNYIKLLLGLALVLMSVSSSWAVLTTLTIPVISSTDDHEEDHDGNSRGINSTDLDLGKDSGSVLDGVRFQNVTIPQGTTIVSAYIDFVAGSPEETPKLTQTVKLRIKGHDRDNAPTFTTSQKNIKDRWDNFDTNNDVYWTINTTWTDQTIVRSPDLKAIAQEIIDRSGWTSGNSLVFMLRRSDFDNKRTVYSYDGSPSHVLLGNGAPHANNYAPRLVITYDSVATGPGTSVCTADISVSGLSASTDDADDRQNAQLYGPALRFGNKWLGLRFTSIPVPKGAQIIKASLKLATGSATSVSNFNSDGIARAIIWGQKSSNALTFSTVTDNIKDRPKTNSNIRWTESNYWNTYQQTHTSPDIAGIIQEIVGQSSWTTNNALALLLEDDKGQRPVLSYDGDSTHAPLLHIEYECGAVGVPQPTIQLSVASSTTVYLGTSVAFGGAAPADTLTVTNSGSANLTYNITGRPTWLGLSKTTGTLLPGASDAIAVTYSSSSQALGTYQGTLTVTDAAATNPNQTVPISLYIYNVDAGASCDNVPLYVKNHVSPAVLFNLDLSGSMHTMMDVSTAGSLPQSPDLSTIVQELVKPGTSWIPGNAMAFIVTGSGSRRAWSFDGQNGSAPQLFVTYTTGVGVPATTISSRVSNKRDDAEQNSDGTGYSDSRNELNLGSRVIGMRFQNLNIPQGATITNAYITSAISSPDNATTSLVFYGQSINDAPRFSNNTGTNVTSRIKTTAFVTWSAVPAWATPTQQSRLAIAQGVIGDVVQNRNINWGFGTWTGDYASSIDYTKIEVGCKDNTNAQQLALQAAIAATTPGGRTPFVPSMDAAGKYFAGTKTVKDIVGGETFPALTCQDKFLIEVTDGMGNIPSNTSAADATTATTNLAKAGISSVAVGFGITNATLINAVAATANTLGNASTTDGIYGLHNEVGGVGQPFLAMNHDELLNSLLNISHKIENRFTGSAPAPTTSADDTDLLMVLVAEFGSVSWTGNLRALGYSLLTNDWTTEIWKASDLIPTSRNIWTATPGVSNIKKVASDTTTGLTSNNYLCKDIGDIIDSSPLIIKWPNSHYDINAYRTFANNKRTRNRMVYVGANDGQLHAFLLTDKKDTSGTVITPGGTEMWSFIPPSLHNKLNRSTLEPKYDLCGSGYCHQYYVDGSPQAADIYVGSAWHTVLISGLREGGEAYFALDVTDGEPMAANTTTGAQYLWEFTDPELGQTWGDAQIKRVVDASTNPEGRIWGAYFGSGYAGAGSASVAQTSSKESYLYGINAYDATPLWKNASLVDTNRIKMDTSGTPLVDDALSELLVIDKDYEANFAADFIYTGNLYGDLYRVANIGKGQIPAVSLLYESTNTTTKQPVRGRPSFAYDKIMGDYWLYFGTGRYEMTADKTSTDQQYFFGLKETPDLPLTVPATYSTTYVKPAGLEAPGRITINTATTNKLSVTGAPDLVVLDSTAYTVTVGTASKTVKVVEGQNAANDPWVIRLGTTGYAERVTTQPLVVAGVVFFTSFVPDADPCGGSGTSYLYALDYKTGKAPMKSVFDINGDSIYNASDYVTLPSGAKVPAAAISLGKGQASEVTNVGEQIFVTLTEPDASSAAGGTKPANPPPKPVPVNLPGLKAAMDSWRDNSLN